MDVAAVLHHLASDFGVYGDKAARVALLDPVADLGCCGVGTWYRSVEGFESNILE